MKIKEFSRVFMRMFMLIKSLQIILDLIFPKSADMIEIEALNIEKVFNKCVKSRKITAVQNSHAVFSYKDPLIRKIVWQMKFKGQKQLAKICGQAILYKMLKKIKPSEELILIPVPIHKKRRAERGFNQCELICDEIVGLSKNNLLYKPDIISRKIYRDKQSWSDKKGRLDKVSGVFEINKKEFIKSDVSKKTVVIIDDVITTGATVNEVRRLLKEAGANKILIFAFAH
jgi:ComF family protein